MAATQVTGTAAGRRAMPAPLSTESRTVGSGTRRGRWGYHSRFPFPDSRL
jgi:hypothetical protein